jgi:PadR family transcriptional regulator PadR
MKPTADKIQFHSLEENLKKALTELLVLHLLNEKECYIGELTEALRQRSGGTLDIVFPYGAIYRLEADGYLEETRKKTAPDGRRRQYVGITELGREYLSALLTGYRQFIGGVDAVLKGGDSNGL